MRRFNFTIAAKLGLSFGAVVVCTLVVVVVGSSGMSSMSSAHNDVVKVGLAKQVAALAARGNASDMHFSETLYVLAGPSQRANYLQDRATFQTAVNKLFALAQPADQHLVTGIRNALAKFDSGDAALWSLARTGQAAAAGSLAANAQNAASDALSQALTNFQQSAAADVAAQDRTFASTASSARMWMVLVGILTGLLAAGLGFWLVRSLSGPARQALAAARGIAEGDLGQHVETNSSDELGQMARAFDDMVAYLREMADAAEAIAAGDLTRRVEPKSDRDALGTAFAQMIEGLSGLVNRTSAVASSVSASSRDMATTSSDAGSAVSEIAHAVSEVAGGAEQQVRMVEAARAATAQMAQAAAASAESAGRTVETAEEARGVVRDGVSSAEDATEAVESMRTATGEITEAILGLAQRSERIDEIVATITSISEQTNLLALNAAIEAARAGEHGRGFAVVAEEVRMLAESTHEAAGQIAILVGEIQERTKATVAVVERGAERTEEGARTVARTREAFERIDAAVDEIAGRIQEIAGAAEQVASGADTIQQSITDVASVAEESSAATEQVSASTEQTSASTQQIASSAEQLARTAEELTEVVGHFRVTADV